jgi:hypothetical protein
MLLYHLAVAAAQGASSWKTLSGNFLQPLCQFCSDLCQSITVFGL